MGRAQIKVKLKLLALLCLAVSGAILTLGLWPFYSPRNGVEWLKDRNGLRFGRFGSVVSSGSFPSMSPKNTPGASLELWVQPGRIWNSHTLLTFYRPGSLLQFSLYQSQTDLLVRTAPPGGRHHGQTASLYVKNVFRRNPPLAFITITSGGLGVWVYIDGVLAVAAPQFPLSPGDLSGRLVLGDSPGQPDSWSGQLLGFAIYNRQLTATQVLHNYVSWRQTGLPEIAEDESNFALYLFDERRGDIVRDQARSGVDLRIPKRYEVEEKIALEPFWSEFSMSRSYWSAVLKNIVGFIPLGFCFYAFLVALPIKRAALATVVLGCAVSFTIEIPQAFLPQEIPAHGISPRTRWASGWRVAYRSSIPAQARFLPSSSLQAPRRSPCRPTAQV